MKHRASTRFWKSYRTLRSEQRKAADKAFERLRVNPSHPALHFKKVGPGLWAARIDRSTRALAHQEGDDFVWDWIGPHDDYEGFLGGE